MNKRTIALLSLLVVSVIWGAASPIVKYTLTWFDPWIFLTYRFALSTLIAIPYLWGTHAALPRKSRDVLLVILTGFVSAPLSLWLFFEALTKTTALSGSLLTAIGPLMLVLGGRFYFHDRLGKNERIGIAIALVGALVTVFGPLIMNGHPDTLGKFEGNLIMLIATLTDAAAALLSKACLRRGIKPGLVAQLQFVIGLFIFVPLMFLKHSPMDVAVAFAHAPLVAHLGAFFMAAISGSFAYTLRDKGLRAIEVSEAAVFSYLQPLWAALLAVIWLHESVTLSYLTGGAIIAIGVFFAEKRNRRLKT